MAAHAEWHRNTGQRYGCPWDACQPPEPERCPACARYLDDDGHCAAEDEPEHIETMLTHQSMLLALTAERAKAKFEKKPELEDPWASAF